MENNVIKFLLNDEIHTVENIDPNTTVLNYLRNDLNRCGTKEGCASGDCGACTVVLGELQNDEIQYISINACISFLPSLHGKQLITVEDLKNGEQLHHVQQSMVDCDGSQCGFCTPGIVMSLYALHKNYAAPSKAEALVALSGNLCRCTGYRSILSAAEQTLPAGSGRPNKQLLKNLRSISENESAFLSDGKCDYFAPVAIDELSKLLAQKPQAKLLAGGTDLALEVTQFHRDIETIIYTGNVAELKTQVESDNSLTLGAAVTYSQCAERLAKEYHELGEMLERLGSLQIRNLGTVGGNIGNASPIGDMPPVLIALGSDICLRRGDKIRTVKLEDYFIDYKSTVLKEGEFIQSIDIPKARPGYQLKVYKISKRIDDDISAVLGAFHLKIRKDKVADATLAFGGMAAIPRRASNAENALRGQPWNQATVDAAMKALEQDFTPLSDVRASAQYRLQVSKNLLQKCFFELRDSATVTRVTGYA